MAIYKELSLFINKLQKESKQIFPDAADFGYPIRIADPMFNHSKYIIEDYGIKNSRQQQDYMTGKSVSHELKYIDEAAVSDGVKSIEEATTIFVLTYVTCTTGACKGFNGYFTINTK